MQKGSYRMIAALALLFAVAAATYYHPELTALSEMKITPGALSGAGLAEDLLGVDWHGADTGKPGGAAPAPVPDGGLGVDWQGADTGKPGGAAPATPPSGGGLGIDWQGADTGKPGGAAPAPAQGGGLGVDWQGADTGKPGGGTPIPATGGDAAPPLGGGLEIEWAGPKAFSEAAVREAWQTAFGRAPTPQEVAAELARNSSDPRFKDLAAYIGALRQYLGSYQGDDERRATAARAAEAVFSPDPVPAWVPHVGLGKGLTYSEMAGRLTIHAAAMQSVGRIAAPSELEAMEAAGDPRQSGVAGMVERYRAQIRTEPGLRESLIRTAYDQARKRAPLAAELSRWDADLRQNGMTFTEMLPVISAGPDPALPLAPVIVRHQNPWVVVGRVRGTDLIFRQAGEEAAAYRIMRLDPQRQVWSEIARLQPKGDGQELHYLDSVSSTDRASYKVCAVNPLGEACSEQYDTEKAPYPVHWISHTVESPATMRLEFEQVGTDADQFVIFRKSVGQNGFIEAARQPADPSAPRHVYREQVTEGTTRQYRVCAVNEHGQKCVEGMPLTAPFQPPKAPTDLQATVLNETAHVLSWRLNGPETVDLQRWNIGAQRWETHVRLSPPANSYQIQETGPEPAYVYRACVTNYGGTRCSPNLVVGKQFDHPTNFTSFDTGIYWFRCGTCRGSSRASDKGATSDGVRAVSGLSLDYYDPTKPTLIYVHGWAENSVKERSREGWKSPVDESADMVEGWKKAGWNVGTFYWNQLSDDVGDGLFRPLAAEGKIDRAGGNIRLSNGKGGYYLAAEKAQEPAARLMAEAIVEALGDYKGPEIRVVGHSLGTQMAILSSYILHKSQYSYLTPKRIALLDDWVGSMERANQLSDMLKEMKRDRGVIFEYYRFSGIASQYGSWSDNAIFVRVHPDYANWNPMTAHASARHWYFLSMSGPSMPAYRPYSKDGVGATPSARMSTVELQKLVNYQGHWEQRDGKGSMTLTDDEFDRWDR